jgi:hypothetical protein
MKRSSEVEPEFQNIYTAFNEKIRRYLARLVGDTEAEDLTHMDEFASNLNQTVSSRESASGEGCGCS